LVLIVDNYLKLKKNKVENSSIHRCALIYGRLPPSNRRTQANLFNNKNNGYDVLVASDAIGMGLNLNIRRVIFDKIIKFNGIKETKLNISEILQIAGRAGRYKLYKEGFVTAINKEDYQYIENIINNNIRPPIQNQACLRPESGHIERVCSQYPWLRFNDVLNCFLERCNLDEHYFMPDLKDVIDNATVLDDIPLSPKDRYIFSTVPMRCVNLEQLAFISDWAVKIANDNLIHLHFDDEQWKPPKNVYHVAELELVYSLLCAYNYLSYRFHNFVDVHKCEILLHKCAQLIQDGFDHLTIQNKDNFVRSFSKNQN